MRYKINLFPPPDQTFLDKVVFFSFHYLRYILVLTQLVVLGVFTFRFTVDQDIVDLKDTLMQKQEIVKLSAPLLQDAVASEIKIGSINNLLKKQTNFKTMFDYYLSLFPEKIVATKLTVSDNSIELDAVTLDVDILQSFYNRLKKDNKFKVMEIKNFRKGTNGYSFTLSLKSFTN